MSVRALAAGNQVSSGAVESRSKGGRETASTSQLDTIPADAGTSATINPANTESSIEFGWVNTPGDADWYRMTVTAGTQYTVILSGYESASGGGPRLPAPLVRVYDSAGALLGSGTGLGAGNASYQFTATTDGFVYVSAEGANGATGRYSTMVIASVPPPPDLVPSDTSTTAGLTQAAGVTGALEKTGDADWYRVELQAGQVYAFELTADSSSAIDPYLQLFDSRGGFLDYNDDYPGQGLGSRLIFMPTESGTYFISAEDFSQSKTGGYSLTLTGGVAFGDIRRSLDWGTRVEGSTVEVYFIPAGETHDGLKSEGWTDYEIGQVFAVLDRFEAVIPLNFVRVDRPDGADFRLMTTLGLADAVGEFIPPGESNAGLGIFQRDATGWGEGGGMEPGGLAWATLVHEIGHGLGLAHPHDDGGTSTVMTGVNAEFDSFGPFGLNQGVYTAMTYNDGVSAGRDAPSSYPTYGNQAGPMALDIAVLQAKYGANNDFRGGDDVYELPLTSARQGFTALWDTGGRDRIVVREEMFSNVIIDLRPATIDYSPTGGGLLSYNGRPTDRIDGGFTIAAGVWIEDASGARGSDLLIGNELGNSLSGGAYGDDTLIGGGGDDLLWDDLERGRLDGGDGSDLIAILEGAGFVSLVEGYAERRYGGDARTRTSLNNIEGAVGAAGDDVMIGAAGANRLFGGAGDDLLLGEGGDDLLLAEAGGDLANGGRGADLINGGDGDDVIGGAENDDLLGGALGNDLVFGDGGNDRVFGDGGVDTVNGGDGDDQVNGGDGDDLIGGGVGTDFLGGGAGQDVVYGDAGNDFMLGDDGNDTVYGGGEGDLVFGGAGADAVLGEAGDDTLFGGQGADFVAGGDGADLVNGGEEDDLIGGNVGADLLGGGEGADAVYGDDGNDALYGDGGNDALFGGEGADTANGGLGADVVNGGAGDDLIGGGDGNDTLGGAAGADTIYGDAGADVLYGDGGTDTLSGGEGADRFVFTGLTDSAPGAADRMLDFRPGEGDRIDLSTLDAVAGTAANEAFTLVGAYSGQAGQAVLAATGGANQTRLSLDVNGDSQADFVLILDGVFATAEGLVL